MARFTISSREHGNTFLQLFLGTIQLLLCKNVIPSLHCRLYSVSAIPFSQHKSLYIPQAIHQVFLEPDPKSARPLRRRWDPCFHTYLFYHSIQVVDASKRHLLLLQTPQRLYCGTRGLNQQDEIRLQKLQSDVIKTCQKLNYSYYIKYYSNAGSQAKISSESIVFRGPGYLNPPKGGRSVMIQKGFRQKKLLKSIKIKDVVELFNLKKSIICNQLP